MLTSDLQLLSSFLDCDFLKWCNISFSPPHHSCMYLWVILKTKKQKRIDQKYNYMHYIIYTNIICKYKYKSFCILIVLIILLITDLAIIICRLISKYWLVQLKKGKKHRLKYTVWRCKYTNDTHQSMLPWQMCKNKWKH